MFKPFLLLGFVTLLDAQTPNQLEPPKDQVLLFKLTGKGSQIYVCQSAAGAYTWVFKAPDAKLYNQDGELAGRHFAGPTWEAKDGSRVKGKLLSSVPSPDAGAIPWLLLTAVAHEGTGTMASIQSIQRLNTTGGKAPAEPCEAPNDKHEVAVPYQANYFFYGARP